MFCILCQFPPLLLVHLFCAGYSLTISQMPTRILTLLLLLCGTGDGISRMSNLMGFPTSQPCWTQAPALPAEVAQGEWGGLALVHSSSCCCCLLPLTVTPPHHRPAVGCSVNACSSFCCAASSSSCFSSCSCFFFSLFWSLFPFSARVWLRVFLPFLKYAFPEVPAPWLQGSVVPHGGLVRARPANASLHREKNFYII